MKTLKVTNMLEMSQVLNIDLNTVDNITSLEDVDDDFGNVPIDLSSAVTPELPHRDFNIATLTPEKLNELRKSSK